MKSLLIFALTIAITTLGHKEHRIIAHPVSPPCVRMKRAMRPFKSERELKQYFARIAEKRRREEARRLAAERRRARREAKASGNVVTVNAPPPAMLESAVTVTADPQQSVTNVQHAGVDEGGIVKVHGNHLVVLRRGRLFTVAIGDGQLKPISTADAFGPDIDPQSSWYDEMLISANRIVVIGYSYYRGGTEIGLFDISDAGQLTYRATYHLRSNDYYSSRNYASRLIGSKLIFYTPEYLNPSKDPFESFPAIRKWHQDAQPSEFRRFVPATRVYQPETEINDAELALHTVTMCDLANGGFDCKATSVIGPPGRVFYVSPDSVYVWAISWNDRSNKALLFRLPLDGSDPTALRVSGSPVDQFSFLQSDDEHLNVLVRSESKGDGMWAAEVAEGDVALLRIPISSFSDGGQFVTKAGYRQLRKPEGYGFQNRFVSDYVIYGTGSGWNGQYVKRSPNLFIANWKDGKSHELTVPHGIDRIEQLGTDAVIVGTDGKDLHFSSVKLSSWPEVISRYTRKEASQGEMRSHGFFYKPDNEYSGTLGLPISTPGRPGVEHLFKNSAAILFLKNDSLHFREIGELESQPDGAVDDKCQASCVDWYGNARPLFLRGRVFALLGYELVEGNMDNGRMRELRRVNFAPTKETTRGN